MIENPIHSCLHPIKVTNPYTGDILLVGCGHCSACMNKRASRYTRLCELESMGEFSQCYFLTLTYENCNIPLAEYIKVKDNYYDIKSVNRYIETGYLNDFLVPIDDIDVLAHTCKCKYFGNTRFSFLYYPDVQLFLKRLRKKYYKDYGETFRYFVVGEYGPTTLRAHWHLILFVRQGKSFLSQKDIHKIWNFGRIDFDRSKGGCISYAASYSNSAMVLPRVYEVCKIQGFNRHSIQLGSQVFSERYLAQISEPLCTRNKRGDEIKTELRQPLLYFDGDYSSNTSITLACGGKAKNYPLDKTFASRLFPKQYGFHYISNDDSILQYYRVYDIYRSYLITNKFLVPDTVKDLVVSFLDNHHKSTLFTDILTFLNIQIDYMDELDYFTKSFRKLYRFFLMSKNSFRFFHIRQIKKIYETYAKNSLTDNLRLQENLIIEDDKGNLNIDPSLFYSTTFSQKMYEKSPIYSAYRNEHEDIHFMKLIKKRFNDNLNLI